MEVNLEDIHIRVLQDILQLQFQLVGLLDGFLYLTVHLVHVQVTVTCLCHVNGRDDIVENLTFFIQQWADIIFYIGVFPVFIRLLHSVTSRCGILVVTWDGITEDRDLEHIRQSEETLVLWFVELAQLFHGVIDGNQFSLLVVE